MPSFCLLELGFNKIFVYGILNITIFYDTWIIQEKEDWEDEMVESDWVKYQWDKTQSKKKILKLKHRIQQVGSDWAIYFHAVDTKVYKELNAI